MAIQTATIPCTQFAMVDADQPRANYHGAESYRVALPNSHGRVALISFGAIPETIARFRLSSVDFRASYNRNLIDGGQLITAYGLKSNFDEETVTYETKPGFWSSDLFWMSSSSGTEIPEGSGQFTRTLAMDGAGTAAGTVLASKILRHPWINFSTGPWYALDAGEYVDMYTDAASSELQPALLVAYDDADLVGSQIEASNAPTGGYINPRNATMFGWRYMLTDLLACAAITATQASATFYWREGRSGDYNAIPISGDALSLTIPANTFPAMSSFQWYLEGTDTYGSTSQTPVYTVSTTAAYLGGTPISPVGTVEDGTAPIFFSWELVSPDSNPPTGYNIQYREPGTTSWTAVGAVTDTDATSCQVPANTFPAGELEWRVSVRNIDGNWGVSSLDTAVAQFVVVAAPAAPIVTVTPVPWATVSWQVEGQQAYRITVDGKIYGPYFGEIKSWTVPDYLRDGEHTIQVEVQGVYGLWSQPGSATFAVANQPGRPITLEGAFDRDAALSWTAGDATANYYIYRDGVQIGHATGLSFNDRLALGPHSYRVINRLPDGNYSISNTVTGTMLSCTAAIAPLSGGEWIELRLSESSDREESFTWSQGVTLRHFAGATYPVAELSPYADESGAYDVAFTDLASAQAFEVLRGRAVILKSRGGNVMIGILATLSKRMTEFYIAYVFTLQRMHWREYIDADS